MALKNHYIFFIEPEKQTCNAFNPNPIFKSTTSNYFKAPESQKRVRDRKIALSDNKQIV
jgi:hypothetical protein